MVRHSGGMLCYRAEAHTPAAGMVDREIHAGSVGAIADTPKRTQKTLTMSEKRKPEVKIFAEIRGKTIKVELFRGSLWPKLFPYPNQQSKWRVRINGKWRLGKETFTMSEVMRQLRGWTAKRLSR
jgi:hypothetical protein